MTDTQTVEVSTVDHSIAIITLQRPNKLNAFNSELRLHLLQAVERVNADDNIKVVVITGAGKGFSCGADLAEQHPAGQTAEDRINLEYKPVLLAITHAQKPYIAAVNGPAAGIGCALALACDLVLMAPQSYLFLAFSAIGLLPDGGISLQLSRQLGAKRAYEVMALGEKLKARECVALGLANAVYGEEGRESSSAKAITPSLDGVLVYAQRLLKRAPLSLRYTKQVMRETVGKSLGEVIAIEAKFQSIAGESEDFTEGKAAFLEKRAPVWKGR
ncbi:hypothetical protein AB833_13315 [Chromatiales bacterium (ex Bugula neritina AB1)]|nr:hypothetical protein AB833_13315 [Chromatiales bacterium (ex Bugula neritina AB1)]